VRSNSFYTKRVLKLVRWEGICTFTDYGGFTDRWVHSYPVNAW